MFTQSVEYLAPKRFPPHEDLIRFMRKRLEITNKMEEIHAAGKDYPVEIEKRNRSLRSEKVKILDKIVFPAMADLVFFFKVYSEHPELKRYFESNIIKDLLGVKRNNPRNDPEENNYGFMFLDLMLSILELRPIFKEKKVDFRVLLLRILYECVLIGIKEYLPDAFKNRQEFHLIFDDMARVSAWMGMLSYPVKDEYDLKNFEKFKEDIKNNSPERTFPYAPVEDYLSGKIKGRKKEKKKDKKENKNQVEKTNVLKY